MRPRREQAGRAARARGFTIIEMTLMIAILGLVLGGLLVPLSTQMDAKRYERVRAQLREAQEAVIGFALTNGLRLPCPDDGTDGMPDLTGTTCDAPEGFLPHIALGLPANDPWGNRLRYRVDAAFAPPAGVPYPADTVTGIVVQDRAGNPLSPPMPVTGDMAALVIFSCGKNGVADLENNGDDLSAAVANCGDPATIETAAPYVYVQDSFLEGTFDDVLVFTSKHALVARLALAGLWPP